MRAIYLLLLSVFLVTGLAWGEEPPKYPGFSPQMIEAYIKSLTQGQQNETNGAYQQAKRTVEEVTARHKLLKTEWDKANLELVGKIGAERATLNQKIAEMEPRLIALNAELETAKTALAAADGTTEARGELQKLDKSIALEKRFKEIEGKGLNEDQKLNAMERKFDNLQVGEYLRDKLSRLMASDFACAASNPTLCTNGRLNRGAQTDAQLRTAADKLLNPYFYGEAGTLGRHRGGSSTPVNHQ